jgi:hypothetical protein
MGGNKLTGTTFIQRLNTAGGVAPAMGCSQSTDNFKETAKRTNYPWAPCGVWI